MWKVGIQRAVAVALLVSGVGCGGDGDDGDEASATDGAESASGSASQDAFPVTVEHALGETVVPAPPERIVTVGYTEHDTVLALGLTPVGVTEWYGEHPYATWPWAQDELGDAEPEVLDQDAGFQYEAIAALRPDLILGTNAGLDATTFDRLSELAPTIAHPVGAEAWFGPWREQTLLIGQAVGRPDEAQALIDDIDAQFAEAAADHPEFAGTPIVFLQNAIYEGEAIAYQEGLSTDFLTDLGFEIPDELDEFVGEAEGSQAYIPLEQLDTLDAAEVLLWATESPEDREALEALPLYRALEEVQEGRLVFTDDVTAGAIYFTSPLSLPFVIEQLVPALASTLAGEGPATIAGTR